DATRNLGETVNDHFRLWWSEAAMHGPATAETGNTTRAIDYTGIISQALRDLIAWSEDGVPPAPSARYELTDGQVVTGPDAAARGGIQPVVRATANGSDRTEVQTGEPVTLTVEAAVPPGTGTIVDVAWDFDDSGTWPVVLDGVGGTETEVTRSI